MSQAGRQRTWDRHESSKRGPHSKRIVAVAQNRRRGARQGKRVTRKKRRKEKRGQQEVAFIPPPFQKVPLAWDCGKKERKKKYNPPIPLLLFFFFFNFYSLPISPWGPYKRKILDLIFISLNHQTINLSHFFGGFRLQQEQVNAVWYWCPYYY